MELILREIALPLRHAFTISQGTTTVQHNLLVELRERGCSGYEDMDGAVLIARDIATGVRVDEGRALFPTENGNGVQLLPGLA